MKAFLKPTLLAVSLSFAMGALSMANAAPPKLETEKDKASYVVGMQIGGSLTQIKDEIDIEVVFAAVRSALNGDEPVIGREEAMEVQKAFAQRLTAKREAETLAAAESNKKEGEAFLAANKGKSGVKTTASGLQYMAVTEGKGAKPAATDTVKVHYVGTLLDGTEFDSSVARGEPAQFALNQVIPGWTEGLQLMPVGSKYEFWIPSELAYGDRSTPGPIGPNATLHFTVDLLEIVAPAAAAATE